MFIFAVRIVDRRKAIALYLLGYYRDYEEYDVDFGCTQATEQQKTTTDHSRNVIVILYIVYIEYGQYFKGLYL